MVKTEMKKEGKIALFILLVIALFLLAYFILSSKGIQVTIENQTEQSLHNLSIEILSNTSTECVSIGTISPDEVNTIPIELPNEFIEGSISLCYYDNNNISHKETIIGYVEQGYNINIQLSIDSIDSDGNLKISIH